VEEVAGYLVAEATAGAVTAEVVMAEPAVAVVAADMVDMEVAEAEVMAAVGMGASRPIVDGNHIGDKRQSMGEEIAD
jgi:hypothetical protein